MYPPARRSDHVDTYFNTPVPDPYRWMEDVDSPEVEAWVTAQNQLTRSVLDAVPGRAALQTRLLALTDFERVSAPTVRNGRFLYAHNTGLQNQAVLLWQDGPTGEPHLLLDPNTLSPDGTVALAGIALSPTGTHLAYALAEAGSDWITWHVKEIGTGPQHSSPDLPDRITRSKFSGASWLPDTSGFVYSGYGLLEDSALQGPASPAPHTVIPTAVEGPASPTPNTVIPTEVEGPASLAPNTVIPAATQGPASPTPHTVIPTEVEGPASPAPNTVIPTAVEGPASLAPNTVIPTEVEGPASLAPNTVIPTAVEGLASPTQPTEAPDDLKSTQHFHKVFLHLLGTPQSADPVLYHRPDDGELLLGGHVTDDGRYLLLTASKGHTNQLHALALDSTLRPTGPLIPIAPTADARYDPIDTDGDTLWLQTTSAAPNGCVIAVNLTAPARESWQTILPESVNNLDSVSMVADTLIATYLADAKSEVHLFTPAGKPLGPLTLPAIGTVSGFSGRRSDTESFVTFTNFTTPPTILRLDLTSPVIPTGAAGKVDRPASRSTTEAVISTEAKRTGETPASAHAQAGIRPTLKPFRAPHLTFNPADFITTQVFFSSKDGTRVPMFLTHRRGLPLDGNNPTLLYAYGGFNISLLPTFSPSYLLWMELGGIFAQPNLRGGGEYGEAWHEAGTRLKKQNVFDDFIAAAEFLITNRYTSPQQLAIEGGSNGGLLVAAVELQRPELFAAAIAHVGVFDMLRFDQFTIGYAWKPDYGSPSSNEPEFRALLRYSPLHNTRPNVAYPPTLVLTADHDDRVFPAHSFKFTAAMQHALTGSATLNPVIPTEVEEPALSLLQGSASPTTPNPVIPTEVEEPALSLSQGSASRPTPNLVIPTEVEGPALGLLKGSASPTTPNPVIPTEVEEPALGLLKGSASPTTPNLVIPTEVEGPASPATELDAAASKQHPTLIRVEVRAGHGAGMPLSKRIDQTVDVYLFLARFLHLPLPR